MRWKELPEFYSESEKNIDSNLVQARDANTEHDRPEVYTDTNEDSEENQEWQTPSGSQVAGRMTGTMEDLERMQENEFMMSEEVRGCIQDCVDCYKTCNQTLIRCLSMGGKHAELDHLNLIMDCARICNTNSDFMLRNSMYYPQTCGITADICDECADVCDRFGDDFMKECASVCRRCAESCREMAR